MSQSLKDTTILFICVRSDQGGGSKHLFDLMTELRKSWPTLTIWSATPLDQPFGPLFAKNSRRHFVLPNRSFSLFIFLKILIDVIKGKIQIIHSHGRGAGIYSRLLGLFGVKVIHTFHGVHIAPGIMGKIKLWVDKILSPFASAYICVSNDEASVVKEHHLAPANKINVITNGIAMPKLLPTPPVETTFIMGTLARLNYQKGIDLGIRFIQNFHQNHPEINFQWQIAGDGEERDQILRLIQVSNLNERIRLIGETQGPFDFLKQIHLYISFARWEGLPLSVLEALGCGRACLVSRVTGHQEIFQNDYENVSFSLEDFAEFEHKLLSLINQSTLRSSQEEQGRARVAKFHSLEGMVHKTQSLYQSLI